MKTLVNKTIRPLRVSLSRGRVLRLGPRKEGQIATQDADRESVKALVAKGDVEVLDEASHADVANSGPQGARAPTQGRRATFSGAKHGDR